MSVVVPITSQEASGRNTATCPNALQVVVEGFEPLELTTPFALGPCATFPSSFPPSAACLTRIPLVNH
jgi:hypothetical protein